jgi:hypothetical protein
VGAVAGGSASGVLGKGYANATHPGWWFIAGLGLVVLVLGLVTTTRWADETARQTASQFREGQRLASPATNLRASSM